MFPKRLHLTCKNKNAIDDPVWVSCLEKFRTLYTDYDIRLYDNDDIYTLIEQHYPAALTKVKQIPVGAVLADIFRYLILYLEGGIYADMDCEPLRPIESLFDNSSVTNGNPDVILSYEFHSLWTPSYIPEQICNWFIIAKPGNYLFKRMLENCFANLDALVSLNKGEFSYEHTILNTTGPAAFTRVVKSVGGNVLVLQSDFFCVGSWEVVPQTANSYIKHHFTSSWKSQK